MGSEVSIPGADLPHRVAELEQELNEAHQREAATADVLKVISRSGLDVQRVLDTLVESAARLCDAHDAAILQVVGDGLRLVAHHGQIRTPGQVGQATIALARGLIAARAVIDRRTIQVADMVAEADEYPESRQYALQLGYRTALGVPLICAGEAIGVIFVRRSEVRPFTERQIELVNTFADQAVIAIENTRLFEAEQTSKRELQESLDYQTATSEVLSAISRSPNELQPVLDAMLQTAARLCRAEYALFFRLQGSTYHVGASNNAAAELVKRLSDHPIHLDRSSLVGRTALERRTVHLPDCLSDPEYTRRGDQHIAKYRSMLGVPLMRDGVAIAVITLMRNNVEPFTEKQIDLVTTFADQALIAIENTRLFEAVQARTKELQESLDRQTATSEVLRAISRVQTDAQPVFEIIAASALRLCGAGYGQVALYDGKLLHMTAFHNVSLEVVDALRRRFPAPAEQASAMGRAIHTRAVVQIPDVQADRAYAFKNELQAMGIQSILVVPMLAKGGPIGAIAVGRQGSGLFPDNQIELLKIFADQAVIAVENARLFDQLQARNRDLTALGQVGRAVSSTLDLKVVLKTIVDRAVELSGTDGGSIFYYREDVGRFELGETSGLDEEVVANLRKLDISARETGLGNAIRTRDPLQIPDLTKAASNPARNAAIAGGLRAALIVPLLGGEQPLGALVLQRREPGEFPDAIVSLVQAFADQSAIALDNARLFEEIAQKGRELEIASQHKSQFVANMSHELRTPLAAILGYAELIQEGFYGPLPDKSIDALTRIRSNGKHLLGLINTVLDIAKIESGQFTLNMAEYAIENVVETVRSATESLAQSKKLALKTEVAKPLPAGLGDEQRLTQVLLNLVGNAIKFTDAGEVRVIARAINGHFNVSVSDTGPGIPAEHQGRIFEQFQQVDNSNTRAKGGTGLGLAIAKQIVEMHGGRIWVESRLGKGSTFQMEIPARAQVARSA